MNWPTRWRNLTSCGGRSRHKKSGSTPCNNSLKSSALAPIHQVNCPSLHKVIEKRESKIVAFWKGSKYCTWPAVKITGEVVIVMRRLSRIKMYSDSDRI